MLTPFEADNLSLAAGHPPRLLHAPGRHVARALCEPQLRPGLGRRPRGRHREPQPRGAPSRRLRRRRADRASGAQRRCRSSSTSSRPRDELAKADALVTKTRGLVVGILTADCGPLLFADPEASVVGAAHAGWRGAFAGDRGGDGRGHGDARRRPAPHPRRARALHQPAKIMRSGLNSLPISWRATPANKRYFETPKAESEGPLRSSGLHPRQALAALGLHSVEIAAPCTYENELLFFSFRRSTHRSEPDYGRQISAIVVT